MQNAMRERMVAGQVAAAREMFLWLGSFYVIAGSGMIAGFARYRNQAVQSVSSKISKNFPELTVSLKLTFAILLTEKFQLFNPNSISNWDSSARFIS